MRVAISNFSAQGPSRLDYAGFWASQPRPERNGPGARLSERFDWGFHIFSIGVWLRDQGVADEVEFWDYSPDRSMRFDAWGVLRVNFHNAEDLGAYLDRHGPPDLYIQHGGIGGRDILWRLRGRSFRVYVPALRVGEDRSANRDADCYLVDDPRFLDARSMLYVPVTNTALVRPSNAPKVRDFVYLAQARHNKRHDILLRALAGSELTCHCHPVEKGQLDVTGTCVTTTGWGEAEVVSLLQTSRVAVYPGDRTSSPAALWECVAAGLPIVVNEGIVGGRHVVVPGVTGELAPEGSFGDVMRDVLARRDSYRPREHYLRAWDTEALLRSYLAFFALMGWRS